MLRKSNPTSNPARFSVKSFQSLLEAVAATGQPTEKKKETKPAIRGGGGFKGSESESKEGYGGRRPDVDTKQASGESLAALYTSGIPLSFMGTGTLMQAADYGLSKLPLKISQNIGAATVGTLLPIALQAVSPEASRVALDATPDLEMEDIPDEYRTMVADSLGIDTSKLPKKKLPISKTARTVTIGGREMSVTPDSVMAKLTDPYGVGSFVDFAKKMGEIQKEKLKKEKERPSSPLRQPTVAPFGY